MRIAIAAWLTTAFVTSTMLVAACGDDDKAVVDNVGPCESLLETLYDLECAAEDYDWAIDCSLYADTACDISDFFTCCEENATCNEYFDPPTVDISGWSDCMDLAYCE
jgi:hypothetical protein